MNIHKLSREREREQFYAKLAHLYMQRTFKKYIYISYPCNEKNFKNLSCDILFKLSLVK